ncbi:MAG: hypothetical protein ACYC09_14930 [Bacteroidota bacterium]
MSRQSDLARHDEMPRLNARTTLREMDDAEQAAYLEQWHRENPNGGWFNRVALVIVCVVSLSIGMVILSRPSIPSTSIHQVHAFINTCPVCHFPAAEPEIKSYGEYRLKHRINVPPVDLQGATTERSRAKMFLAMTDSLEGMAY